MKCIIPAGIRCVVQPLEGEPVEVVTDKDLIVDWRSIRSHDGTGIVVQVNPLMTFILPPASLLELDDGPTRVVDSTDAWVGSRSARQRRAG